jgi:hypothetical protein
VARIRARVREGTRVVTIKGPLLASDLRRLEHACGPALERREIQLEIRLEDVSEVDEASRAFLDGLTSRGATLA